METSELLIFLLREAIGERSSEGNLSLDEAELISLYKLARSHDLAHLVGAELSRRGLLPEGKEVTARFQKEQMLAVYRCENLDFETETICRTLSEVGIDHIPLKGAVIRGLYPERWMRTSCDVDILVKERDLDTATEILCQKLGYEKMGGKDYHDISLTSKSGFHLELHHNIMEKMPLADKVLSKVWDHAMPWGNNSFSLGDEYLIFHVIAHAAYHFLGGGCGVRTLLDLHFMKKGLNYDQLALKKLLKEAELELFAENLFALCEYWFEDGESSDILLEMGSYVISGGAYGTMEQHIANIRTKSGKKKYVFSRIFLPYDSLKILYPQIEGKRAVAPIYQVKRWFKLTDKSKRDKIKRELRTNGNVDADELAQTRVFLEKLGLDKNME